MKTRSLIIMLSIFTAITISVVFGYEQYSQSINNYEHLSSLLNDDSLCFDSSDEKPVEVCYTLNELETYKCSIPILERLAQHSNLLDAEFTRVVYVNLPSLPNNISEKDYDACIEFLKSVRLPSESESEEKLAYGVTQEFEGVIIDQRLGKESHEYHFFTNKISKISTGSSGIQLEGIDHRDNLDGKYVKLFGSISKKGEEIITVDEIQVLYSIIPTGLQGGEMLQASIDEVHANPDQYYNQMIVIKGELREHDADVMAHRGVGCDNAKFTTSDDFVAEFISSQQLYDDKGDKHLGVRIGSADNIGISKSELLPMELKNNQVEMTGLFVPAIREMNWCNAVIYNSGYILTNFEKIKVVE